MLHVTDYLILLFFFFFNATATTEIYTLSLHDALPISDAAYACTERPSGECSCVFCPGGDRKSTRLNSSHEWISYAVFCLKKKKVESRQRRLWRSKRRGIDVSVASPRALSDPRPSICRQSRVGSLSVLVVCFFFKDPATTEIYTLSLHDALPILREIAQQIPLGQRRLLERRVGGPVHQVEVREPDLVCANGKRKRRLVGLQL